MATKKLSSIDAGWLFCTGRGVTQDYVEAHKWYNILASRGLIGAAEKREIIEKI